MVSFKKSQNKNNNSSNFFDFLTVFCLKQVHDLLHAPLQLHALRQLDDESFLFLFVLFTKSSTNKIYAKKTLNPRFLIISTKLVF